jgi:hypothetical protein
MDTTKIIKLATTSKPVAPGITRRRRCGTKRSKSARKNNAGRLNLVIKRSRAS